MVIRSDNRSAFRKSFGKWCGEIGIVHTISAPYHTQSNGSAEWGDRELKMLLKKTKAKGLSLAKLILELNNMEHQGYSCSLAVIF